MKEFLILCKSCARRLKVTKPAMIGKVLACPKCGTMLEIKAPPETDSTASPGSDPKLASPHGQPPLKSSLTQSDYDEIGELLENHSAKLKNQSSSSFNSQSLPDFDVADASGNAAANTAKQPKNSADPETSIKKSTASSRPAQGSPPRIATQKSKRPPATAASPSNDFSIPIDNPTVNPIDRLIDQPTDPHRSLSGHQDTRFKPSPRQKPSQAATAETAAPLLPDDSWVSPETQLRRKRVIVIAILAGSLILALVGLSAWFSRPAPLTNLAATDPDQPQTLDQTATKSDENAPENLATKKDAQPNSNPSPNPNSNPPIVDGPTRSADANLETSLNPTNQLAPDLATGQVPPGLATDPLAVPAPNNPLDPNSTPPELDNSSPPENQNRNPGFSLPPFPSSDSGLNSVGSKNRFGTDTNGDSNRQPVADSNPIAPSDEPDAEVIKLSELLESNGMSLASMRDIASRLRDNQNYGMPKYFIEKQTFKIPDYDRQLSNPVSMIRYDQTELSTVLKDLMLITGLSISIDPYSIRAELGTANPIVTFAAENINYGQALDQLLEPINLQKIVLENGEIRVQSKQHDQLTTVDQKLPPFPFTSPEEQKTASEEFVMGVQGLVDPTAWQEPDKGHRILFDGDQLKLTTNLINRDKVKELVEKVDASFAVTKDKLDLTGLKRLRTRTQLIESRLQKPAGLKHRMDEALIKFVEQLKNNTQTTILVDWESLRAEGWGPNTSIPGLLIESTLEDALHQLTRSMGITYLAVDDVTVLLTSFQTAATIIDLEVYSFETILAGKLKQNQALQLIYSSIGTELFDENVRIIYEPKYVSLIVSAPQSTQRRISAILKALEEL